MLKRALKRILYGLGYECRRIITPPMGHELPNPIHLWDNDEQFNALYSEMRDRTLVDKQRCYILYQLATQALSIPGDAAEIGVFKGGTAKLLAKVLSKKTLHLFDTFAGMPPTDKDRDIHREGDFSDTSLKDVASFLTGVENVVFYAGLFPDTGLAVEKKTFSFVHIDVDIYRSVMDCCAFFYPRIKSGGIMAFDDYGFISCPGAKEAVDEFFSDKRENAVYLPTGQSVVIKL